VVRKSLSFSKKLILLANSSNSTAVIGEW